MLSLRLTELEDGEISFTVLGTERVPPGWIIKTSNRWRWRVTIWGKDKDSDEEDKTYYGTAGSEQEAINCVVKLIEQFVEEVNGDYLKLKSTSF